MPFAGFKDFDACVLAMKEKGHDEESAKAICGKMQKDAEMLEARFGEISLDQVRAQIEAKLSSGWVREMFRSHVIIARDDKLYKATYTVEGEDVTIGDLEEVQIAYEPAGEMADFNSAWIEIFRAGDYGDKGEWTEKDIDQVVSNFSAGVWKAPAVLGHPKNDSPAMGWVKELQRQGKTLIARFDQVQPELEGLVAQGRFPNRSAAFYTDPQGKGPVLRHVGFLGAVPPEVKGLTPIKFASEQFTSIDFQEEDAMNTEEQKKTIVEAVKAYFAELFGGKKETPAATFSEADVKAQVTAATAPLVEQIKQLTAQFTELGKTLQTSATETKKANVKAFIEGLKAKGKWIPAFDGAGVPAMLEHAALTGGTVKFGEPGKEKEIAGYDAFCAFLEQLPAIVPKGEIAGKVKGSTGKVIQFNEARGIDVDAQSIVLNERAEKIAAERKISFAEALPLAIEEMSA